MKNIGLIIVTNILCFIFCFTSVPTHAQIRVTTAEQVDLDTSAIRDDTNFTLPDSILIVPLAQSTALASFKSGEEFYKAVYFYTLEILGFNDTPFHYFVDSDGVVYRGNKGGEERTIRISGFEGQPVVIGYLPESPTLNFSDRANQSITELAEDIANSNSIPPEDIFVQSIDFIRDAETRSVRMEATEIFGNWESSVERIRTAVFTNYAPIPKEYSLVVEEVSLPTEARNPGDIVEASITLENVSFNGMYAGSDAEILLEKQGSGASAFAVNGEWLSTNSLSLMREGDVLQPLDTTTFSFILQVPLFVGEVQETFILRTLGGAPISSEPITITLNVARTDRRIVEILETETGTLNVRQTPSSVGETFTQVSPGQRFFVLEDAGNGWLRIDLGNEQTGWIAGWYTRDL